MGASFRFPSEHSPFQLVSPLYDFALKKDPHHLLLRQEENQILLPKTDSRQQGHPASLAQPCQSFHTQMSQDHDGSTHEFSTLQWYRNSDHLGRSTLQITYCFWRY